MMTFGNVTLLNYDNWCVTASREDERNAYAEQARYDIRPAIHDLGKPSPLGSLKTEPQNPRNLPRWGTCAGQYWSAIPTSASGKTGRGRGGHVRSKES